MATRLYTLLDQLLGISPVAHKLRADFHNDPNPVTKDLDADGRFALYSMDRTIISARVSQEILTDYPADYLTLYKDFDTAFKAWQFPQKEFPRSDLPPACQGADGEQPQYPDPQPRVYRIKPSFVKAGTASPLAIEVVGQGLVTGKVTLALQPKGGANPLTLANQTFSGTFRCAHLFADLTVPATVTNAGSTDVYNVVVTVDAGDAMNPKPVPVPSTVTFEVRP